ncbi:MAG: aminotransferase class I/II-fold pyridoxal phosphate-dependent enzyme [Waddliaceae bacterium]|jgi:methionine-gamma-lyase|nr:aminotransferase class I/II-fold pyridoxal phosphate-dependent enzyme [Waddliaceae bacterium]MBT3578744.1 aminotransferase class I/II-fold pyridoxal phosphate-dependent enzyme [Waddliaceae bacterium]MBT4444354.1 aminotransferase class I/II-fold pyridoxal phosphate-dependent enzyme [Waddliaceae bacterium]MBT6928269.1 aminotransferase class I/II-fold pyridoxal phosphate-dependent enzyme [Waddliaceae bacterium]MBT7461730.1 aminotransferase class I/II-fold pyridoxal phosphate-dependent enzyme [W
MSANKKHGFNTNAVHGGYHAEFGPVNPPIEESSTYVFKNCDDGAERFASKDKDGIYSRLSNGTVVALEKKLAIMEHGYGSIATSSGMSAISSVLFHYLSAGSHAICTASVYGCSRVLLESDNFFKKMNIETTFLDTSVAENVAAAIRPNTKIIFIETPANPTLSITDITAIAAIAKDAGIPLVVDNTFLSPYLQNPLDLGANVVVHSMTKSIGGHADAVGGVIIPKEADDYYSIRSTVIMLGGTLPPHEASLFNKGLKTLAIRMDKMQENTIAIAQYLESHPKISWVTYPGLKSHPQHALVSEGKQMKGPGSLISFGVVGGLPKAKALLDNLKIAILAVSLGGVETLIQHPASMTHAGIPQKGREAAGISEELVRISIGIEDFEDLRLDFEQAFEKV